MQILLPERTHRRVAAEIERIAPNAKLILMRDDGGFSCDGRAIEAGQAEIEIAWASRDLYILEEQSAIREFMIAILKSQSVRWMHSGGAGFDHPIFATISDKGVRLTNSDSGAIAMAEYVLGGVLDVYQRSELRRTLQADRSWKPSPFREICQTTWLVIGLGNIGREVSLRAQAFGAHVVGVRRKPVGDEPVAEMITPDALPKALGRADVVVLCAALNDSTRQMVDVDFLGAMKADSILVNVARGGMVDETALLASLERGIPEHALLDVFETEPLPAESPFWQHPRVRLTSHCAAGGSGSSHRSDLGFLANLGHYLAGEPLAMEVAPAELR